jgi:death on curing protein
VSPGDPIYLREEELCELHARLMGFYGGIRGVRDPGALASCIAQPPMAVFGQERFPTLHAKGAAYCFFIVRNHPFLDGNKRAGFAAALHFLLMNGITPRFDEERMYQAILAVAKSELDIDGLIEIFRVACSAEQ